MAGSRSYPKGSTPFRNADPIVLAQALAAARINVRGTGRMEDARRAAAEEVDRTPNWDDWRLIPKAELWECVALSLNIDPPEVRRRIRGGGFVFEESDEFNTRLRIAVAQEDATLQCLAIVMDAPSRRKVSVRQFAGWVRGVTEWPAPPGLLAMADEHDPGVKVEPRAHNKCNTEARNREWQESINQLAQDSPGKSHSDYCRTLAKQIGVPFPTVRRNTKLGHS